ncbi:MAG: ABC transporter ATP-binding protein [Candidatus Humimicrobiaceae bacterium]
MIEVKNLFHDYEGKGNYAVNNISFKIEKGEILGFLGPSGAGKTTVQNIMIGLLPIQRGEVLYDGISIKKMKSGFFNRIGVSFEDPALYLKLTGFENLQYFAGLYDVKTKDPIRLLDMVGLKGAANKRASNYSKGMKQRLTFARSLINSPGIMFLDEPTAGLDPSLAKKIKDIILKEKEAGRTIFLTTHNMFIADELCDRVSFINEGRLVATDSPRNLKLKYGSKAVKVEYTDNGRLVSKVLFLEKKGDLDTFNEVVNKKDVQTVHSQEATLEQIFIKLTGRELV